MHMEKHARKSTRAVWSYLTRAMPQVRRGCLSACDYGDVVTAHVSPRAAACAVCAMLAPSATRSQPIAHILAPRFWSAPRCKCLPPSCRVAMERRNVGGWVVADGRGVSGGKSRPSECGTGRDGGGASWTSAARTVYAHRPNCEHYANADALALVPWATRRSHNSRSTPIPSRPCLRPRERWCRCHRADIHWDAHGWHRRAPRRHRRPRANAADVRDLEAELQLGRTRTHEICILRISWPESKLKPGPAEDLDLLPFCCPSRQRRAASPGPRRHQHR